MKRGKNKVSIAEIRVASNLSTSEDDEDGELLTDELEKGFFKVLSRLKKKDSKLYEETLQFFPVEDSNTDFESHKVEKKKRDKVKKDYKEWLKGQKDKIEDEEVKRDLEALHDFWANPNLSKEDQFLRDYILNKKFVDEEEYFDVEKALKKLDEEEKELQEEVIFEQKYNHRFEATDNEFLKQHLPILEKPKKRKSDSVTNTTENINKKKGSDMNGELEMRNNSKSEMTLEETVCLGNKNKKVKKKVVPDKKNNSENTEESMKKKTAEQFERQPKPAEITFGKKRKSDGVTEIKEKQQKIEVPDTGTKPITKKKRRKQKTKSENKSAIEEKTKVEKKKIPAAKRFKKKDSTQYKSKLSQRKKILNNVSLYSKEKSESEKKKENRRKVKIRHRVLIKALSQTVKPSKQNLQLVKMVLMSEKLKKFKNNSVIRKRMKKREHLQQPVQSGKKGAKVKARTRNKSGK